LWDSVDRDHCSYLAPRKNPTKGSTIKRTTANDFDKTVIVVSSAGSFFKTAEIDNTFGDFTFVFFI